MKKKETQTPAICVHWSVEPPKNKAKFFKLLYFVGQSEYDKVEKSAGDRFYWTGIFFL
jgi:hypothetical protein